VGNHLGYLDVVALSASCPAIFVSKDDLAGWPVMGYLGKSVGTLFLDRARTRAVAEVGEAMRAAFAAGVSVIVFPEGTTTTGDRVGDFHSSLFEPALRADVPVRPVALSYATAGLAAWVGDASFVPHFWRLLRARGLTARLVFGTARTGHSDRRAAARAAREWIVDALGAGYREDGPNHRRAASATVPVSWAAARTGSGACAMATARPASRSSGRSLAESPTATASPGESARRAPSRRAPESFETPRGVTSSIWSA
jgi:1-acyl-sn-glycerol-3-phosphate acyltransferase